MRDKILWEKPDYKNEIKKVSEKEVDRFCSERTYSTGDIKIEREQYGRTIRFFVFRLEKVGKLVEGIDTLTRDRAIQELKKIYKNEN